MSNTLKQHDSVKYSDGLNSQQVWEVLNNIIFEAAAPLVEYGDMALETAISSVVLSTNNRRKIGAQAPEALLTDLFYETVLQLNPKTSDSLGLLQYLLTKGIERNIFVDHIIYSFKTGKFDKVDKDKLRRHIKLTLRDYDTFKRDVVFRYYHLISTFANRNQYVKSLHGLESSQSDMFHVYIISSMRAIDKFIPFKGTLSSYIQQWFQNAEGSSEYIVYDGEALSVNRAVRKSMHDGEVKLNNRSIPIEDREHTLVSEEVDDSSELFAEFSRHFAKLPNAPIVFLAQNLPYYLSPSQIARIKKHNETIDQK